jgi:hypothetical protein
MLVATTAVLFVLNATGLLLLVLGRGVVAVLAVGAFESNDVTHGRLSVS